MTAAWRRVGCAGVLFLVACATPAYASTSEAEGGGGSVVAVASLAEVAATLKPNTSVWSDDGSAAGPVRVVVSIPEQRAYVYRGATLIGAATVSTGRDGKETPAGVYPILQKEAVHRSNLYNSAPMPFMQRLTWDGIALHSGKNPGFPDSHGCVRLPDDFAKKLFAVTTVGSVVVVDDGSYGEDALTVAPPPSDTADETADANRQIAAN